MDQVIANLEALAKQPRELRTPGKRKLAPTRSAAMAAAWTGKPLPEDRKG